jgi:hypothetical protein
MNESCRLKCVAGSLEPEITLREIAQLGVDQSKQLIPGVFITTAPIYDERGDVLWIGHVNSGAQKL